MINMLYYVYCTSELRRCFVSCVSREMYGIPQYKEKQMKGNVDRTMIANSLYNCTTEVTTEAENQTYGRGVFVGVVSTLMAMGNDFEETIIYVCTFSKPENPFNYACVPENWIDDVKALIE